MNRRGSNNSYQNGPELRSIRMSAGSASNEPSIAFSSGLQTNKHVEEPLAVNQPLHTQEWNLPLELPTIPSDYTLGYSHATISDASPQTVADRIVEGLALHSVAAMPHESQENTLLAEATCGLKFAVNLFQNSSQEVVVEVERRIGCAYGFHVCCNAVLKTAKGIPLEGSFKSLQVPKCIPQEAKEERLKSIQFDCEQALGMVRSERMDAQLLGLESLERLSQDEYAASLLHTNESIASIQSFLANDSPTCVMKRRALGILANILKVEKEEGPCDQLQCQNFLQALITAVQNFTTSPHEAYAATKCLQSSVNSLSQEKHDNLTEILRNYQARNHSQLAQESKVLQERLRGSK